MPRVYPSFFPAGTIIYQIRHDFSIWQREEELGKGIPDLMNGLYAFGTRKLFRCAKLLTNELKDVDPATILAGHSPHLRSGQTHKQISDICDPENRWNYMGEDLSMRETEHGINEGFSVEARRRRAQMAGPQTENDFFQAWQAYNDKHYTPEARAAGAPAFCKHAGGESYADVYDRMKPSLIVCAQTMEAIGANIFVSTKHGGANRAEAGNILGLSAAEYGNLRNPQNCEIWKITISDSPFIPPKWKSVTYPHASLFENGFPTPARFAPAWG